MKYTNKSIAIAVVAAAVLTGAGFFGGALYQKSQTVKPGRNFGGPGAAGIESSSSNITRRSGGLQGGFTSGDIVSKDSDSITLKLRDGGTRIIFYSNSTQISKQTGGTVDDLAVGLSIMVTGTANSDGSISAQSISLRPADSNAGPVDAGIPSGANPAGGNAPAAPGQPAAPAQN
ncbi:MAG: hypothetical protein WA093_03455 [Minisyncoccales bacterium]